MDERSSPNSPSRRNFLSASTGVLAAAVAAPNLAAALAESTPSSVDPAPQSPPRKIPIGVFDPVFENVPLDAMIEKISAMGIEAVEIGTGGYPGSPHCPVQELLDDSGKLRAWKK